jgi:glutathione S-transferase
MRTAPSGAAAAGLSWTELASLAGEDPDRTSAPCNAQALLRPFGRPESAIRVTLYRDHHAWCPYCQKVWLWLEQARIPYRVRKVTMVCYGRKEAWFRGKVPSGMLPALELDGRLITESDRILAALEQAFGPVGIPLEAPEARPLRHLERRLFQAWCRWLCAPGIGPASDRRAGEEFRRVLEEVEAVLSSGASDTFLPELSCVDLIFAPYLERMNASLAYYKGVLLRREFPALDRWFTALEATDVYRGTQGDFHTHAHDLPPQMGGCIASGDPGQQALAAAIDGDDPGRLIDAAVLERAESTRPVGRADACEAIRRVLRHRRALRAVTPVACPDLEAAHRAALTHLATGESIRPPQGSAAALRYLRDRISVPRDMGLPAARLLRRSLEATAALDGPQAGPRIPTRHRHDQDPARFAAAGGRP